MSSRILIGSIAYGSSGIGCRVLGFEDDILTVETFEGIRKIALSKVKKIEPPPLIEQLISLASLSKSDATIELTSIAKEFTTNSIYETSLDLEIPFGSFIRRLLCEINPVEFDEIGKDGSEGKYGIFTFED